MRTLTEGQNAKGYLAVTGGAYGIPERLKELDERFFVMYNLTSGRFEVHVRGQAGDTLGCELPFHELDARAVTYVRERMGARFEVLSREVEEYNERLERASEAATLDKAGYKMKQALRYLDAHTAAESAPKELINE